MSELRIIETVGDSPNAEFGKWYEEKVRETAKFFVKNMDPGYFASQNSRMTVVDASTFAKSFSCNPATADKSANSGITLKELVAK
jgi:hypothetical protein